MGERRRGNVRMGDWGKKYKKKLGSNKCSSKGGTNRIFTDVSHLYGGTEDTGGCQDPISSLYPSPNSSHHHTF